MHYIIDFFKNDKLYFYSNKQSITAHNNKMLFDGCILYGLVLFFYTVLSVATWQPTVLRHMYYMYDILHIVLCATVFTIRKRHNENFFITQLMCAIFVLLLLSFFALEGALTSRTQHSLYIPIAILLVQLLFIHRAVHSFCMILIYTVGFSILSWVNKSSEASCNDTYIAMASLISASIGFVLISNLRKNERRAVLKLEEINKTDMLTGIYNKVTSEQLCTDKIARASDTCAVFMIDIDNFKNINDQYGHEMGDEVLHIIGAILQDIFGSGSITGRIGGDEFIVLMESCKEQEIVRNKAELLQQKLKEITYTNPDLKVSCSVGVAFSTRDDNFRSAFLRADKALYEAKRGGKNSIIITQVNK